MSTSSRRILLGVSGSVAAFKAPQIVRLFKDKGHVVRCVMTKSAEQFVSKLILSTFCEVAALSDIMGPDAFTIPHVKWAEDSDVYIIAPATATVLARCAIGLAEDMVTLMHISAPLPTLIAPAMHNTMWEHPATQQNVKILKDRGCSFIGPFLGPLADKSLGEGRMAEPEEIVSTAEKLLQQTHK